MRLFWYFVLNNPCNDCCLTIFAPHFCVNIPFWYHISLYCNLVEGYTLLFILIPKWYQMFKVIFTVIHMDYKCKYCDSSFKNRCTLYKHQRTAKYCLKLQDVINKKIYLCTFCNKNFSRPDSLKRHKTTCTCREMHEQPVDQNTQLQDMIADLQHTIQTMSTQGSRPVVLNNLQPLTDEDLQEHLENLTIDFIQEGGKGYADFAGGYPFKDRLVCTDKSRKKIKYRDEHGEIIDDGGGIKITQRFFQAIAPRNEEIINAEYRALHEEVQDIADKGTAHCTDLTGILTRSTKLQQLLSSCQEAARGQENDLTKEFINHLTKII